MGRYKISHSTHIHTIQFLHLKARKNGNNKLWRKCGFEWNWMKWLLWCHSSASSYDMKYHFLLLLDWMMRLQDLRFKRGNIIRGIVPTNETKPMNGYKRRFYCLSHQHKNIVTLLQPPWKSYYLVSIPCTGLNALTTLSEYNIFM